ncbi:MAG: FAD binding domain-containing protein [Candidatus Lindowbacteria bacterium]|nr:FAD binding domain-containing protein [Candidatus Lindowbacteria bacterium]
MLPNVSKFYRPKELSEAVKLLNSDTELNVVLGGGTQLALSSHPGIQGLVDLSLLPLGAKKVEGDRLILGARLRPNDLWDCSDVNSVADGILAKSAGNYLANVQRNRASLGGILMSASAWAEIATTLLAIGGEVTIVTKDGEKDLTFDEFFTTGPSKAAYRSIIKDLKIQTGGRGAYLRLAKTETDIPIVSAAARLEMDGSKVTSARIVVGAACPLPIRATSVEDAIIGQDLTVDLAASAAETLEIDAVGDYRASSEYRKDTARVLVKRCLAEIAK